METNKKIDRLRAFTQLINALGQPLIAVLLSLLIGAIVIRLKGESVLSTYATMFGGAFGSAFYLSATLSRATPIVMGGLAVCIAWRSGYEVMGGEGQMIFGAFLGALVAAYCPGPGILRIALAMLAAMVSGAAYSALSGWLYEKFQVTFIISTLMLNYIANNLCSYFTAYVLRDPKAADIQSIQTMKIAEGARLPRIFSEYQLHWGFVLALACVILTAVLIKKTSFGYKARMSGLNPRFAQYGGVNGRKMLYRALILSGVMAGLGGAFEVLGAKYRYIDQMIFTTAYAWSGMVAALLAGFDPLGTLLASVLLAGLATGGTAMQRSTSIPVEAVNMIEGIITILMSVKLVRIVYVRRGARRADAALSKGGEAR